MIIEAVVIGGAAVVGTQAIRRANGMERLREIQQRLKSRWAVWTASPTSPQTTKSEIQHANQSLILSSASLGMTVAGLALAQPWPEQYIRWLGRTLRGDLSTSITAKRPVAELIGERLPLTLRLTLTAYVWGTLFGILLGTLAAVTQNRWLDHLITYTSLFWFSMPGFWLGLMLILVFGIWLHWAPISGHRAEGALILPALTLALPQMGALSRIVRSEMMEVLGQGYLTTARAKGIPPHAILLQPCTAQCPHPC